MGSLRYLALFALTACRLGFDATADARSGSAQDSSGMLGDGPLPSTLLVWLKFDEAAGTGSVVNSASTITPIATTFTQQGVPGISGSAIQFASVSDGIVFDDARLVGLTALTIESWLYYDAYATSYSSVAKKEGSYILRTCDVGSCGPGSHFISSFIWDSTDTKYSSGSPIQPALGTWYHLAFTYDGTVTPRVLRTFWNGVLVDTQAPTGGTGALFDSAQVLAVGRADPSGENLIGRLDEFRLWSEPRTEQQICESAHKTWSGTACN